MFDFYSIPYGNYILKFIYFSIDNDIIMIYNRNIKEVLKMGKTLLLRLSEKQLEEIKKKAKELEISVSAYIRMTLKKSIKK